MRKILLITLFVFLAACKDPGLEPDPIVKDFCSQTTDCGYGQLNNGIICVNVKYADSGLKVFDYPRCICNLTVQKCILDKSPGFLG